MRAAPPVWWAMTGVREKDVCGLGQMRRGLKAVGKLLDCFPSVLWGLPAGSGRSQAGAPGLERLFPQSSISLLRTPLSLPVSRAPHLPRLPSSLHPAPGWARRTGRNRSMCLLWVPPCPNAPGHRWKRTSSIPDVSQAWSVSPPCPNGGAQPNSQ